MSISSIRFYPDAITRIGRKGQIWYEPSSNTLRVSDGVTPGGQIITSPDQKEVFGYFYSLADQTITNTETHLLNFGNTESFSGNLEYSEYFGVESTNRIRFESSGLYELTCRLQMVNDEEYPQNVYVWFRKNGLNVNNSATVFTVTGAVAPGQVIFGSNLANITLDENGASRGTDYSQGLTASVPPSPIGGITATIGITINSSNGRIETATITNSGSGYTAVPEVLLNKPGNVEVIGVSIAPGNVLTVSNVSGIFVGMAVNAAFSSTARVTTVHTANSNIVINSANISPVNVALSFGDVGSGGNIKVSLANVVTQGVIGYNTDINYVTTIPFVLGVDENDYVEIAAYANVSSQTYFAIANLESRVTITTIESDYYDYHWNPGGTVIPTSPGVRLFVRKINA